MLIKGWFKLLTDCLDVRWVDNFGLLRLFLLALSWLFFSPVMLFDCSLDELFWIAAVMQLRCDAFLQFCPLLLKQNCLLGRIKQ